MRMISIAATSLTSLIFIASATSLNAAGLCHFYAHAESHPEKHAYFTDVISYRFSGDTCSGVGPEVYNIRDKWAEHLSKYTSSKEYIPQVVMQCDNSCKAPKQIEWVVTNLEKFLSHYNGRYEVEKITDFKIGNR